MDVAALQTFSIVTPWRMKALKNVKVKLKMCMDVPFIQERTTSKAVGAQYFLCGRSIRLIMTHLGIGESQWTPLLNYRHHLPFAKWKAF